MKLFSNFVIKRRVAIIAITILITLILGYFVKGLKINPDILSYLPKNDPAAKTFNYIGEKYGGNSIAMVAIETRDVFNKDTIEQINYLTRKFKLVDGVSDVTSLTNVIDIKKDEYVLPKSDAKLQELKKYTLSKDLYCGKLVPADAKAALIMPDPGRC